MYVNLQANRDENPNVDAGQVKEDAAALFSAGGCYLMYLNLLFTEVKQSMTYSIILAVQKYLQETWQAQNENT